MKIEFWKTYFNDYVPIKAMNNSLSPALRSSTCMASITTTEYFRCTKSFSVFHPLKEHGNENKTGAQRRSIPWLRWFQIFF